MSETVPRRQALARFALISVVLSAAGGALTAPTAGAATDCSRVSHPSLAWAACAARNLAASNARARTATPELRAAYDAGTKRYQQQKAAALRADPERKPTLNSCSISMLCPIDPRMEGWAERGGIVKPVLYTSRSGATMSGNVWATVAGPAKRPGVIITNGSIIGFEQGYWFVAQTLAKAGFVVMTFDVQGEGMSDQFGAKPDELEDAFAGIPVLGALGPKDGTGDLFGGNGLTFYDGTSDALDFLLSTPSQPFKPVNSRTSNTSHAAKQQRRVAAGLNAAYNPLWSMLDRSKIGLTGHSYGAQAASWLGQTDPRVGAVVGIDSLCVPVAKPEGELHSFTTSNPDYTNARNIFFGFARDCFDSPELPANPRLTKPALGINGDYLVLPLPYLSPPHPLGKARPSLAYSAAGVDTGQITIRSATHLDFFDDPRFVPSSVRGIDIAAWYTTAWFRKYLIGDAGADAMLLTQRWRSDARAAAADSDRDANTFSWHYRSRLDIRRSNGSRFTCEDLRNGCAGQTGASADGFGPDYSFITASR